MNAPYRKLQIASRVAIAVLVYLFVVVLRAHGEGVSANTFGLEPTNIWDSASLARLDFLRMDAQEKEKRYIAAAKEGDEIKKRYEAFKKEGKDKEYRLEVIKAQKHGWTVVSLRNEMQKAKAALDGFIDQKFSQRLEQTITETKGGNYSFDWSGHGVSKNIQYSNTTVLAKDQSAQGSYCVAATFEAFADAYLVALRKRSDELWLRGEDLSRFRKFKYAWFVQPDMFPNADESKRVSREGCAYAIETAFVGEKVELDKLRRGDFIQFWYMVDKGKEAGHSAIVWGVEREEASQKVKRIWYWSSQKNNYDFDTRKKMDYSGYGLAFRDMGDTNSVGKIFEIHAARVTGIK